MTPANAKPTPLTPILENIPLEFKSLTQWVLWAYEHRDGKWTKVPSFRRRKTEGGYVSGKAKANDSNTWMTFQDTVGYFEKNQIVWAGVGLELHPDDPYSGIDIDHCRDPETGELSELAQTIASALDSYTEVSPSGTGLRIFVRGNLPPGGRKHTEHGVEMYDSGRYLTITGHKIAGYPDAPQARQDALEKLHGDLFPPKPKSASQPTSARGPSEVSDLSDTALLEQAGKAKNGAKFSSLWAGDWQGAAFSSQSEADLSLAGSLWFWTGGDAARADRLFHQSGLMREKWDTPHFSDGRTYGQATLERCEGGEVYKPSTKETRSSRVKPSSKFSPRPGVEKNADEGATPFVLGYIPESYHEIPKPDGNEYKPWEVAGWLGLKAQYPRSEQSAAERFLRHFQRDVAYAKGLGWLRWNGKHWQLEGKDLSRIALSFKEIALEVKAEAEWFYDLATVCFEAIGKLGNSEQDDKEKNRISNYMSALLKEFAAHKGFIQRLESQNFLAHALGFVAGEVHTEPRAFEPRAWVIGFDSGVWDRGTWREHQREDFMLNLSPVAYSPDADRTQWIQTLERITGYDTAQDAASRAAALELATTLQDVAGYTASGESALRVLPFSYGPKGTGKSTFSELILTALGEMATTVDPAKLTPDSRRGRLGGDIWGKRLIVCAEAGNARIDAELLKTLSGGDRYPVQFLYQETFTATPTHILLMVANDAPRMDAYDEALQDRIFTLPFPHPLTRPGAAQLCGGRSIEAVRRDSSSELVRGFVSWMLEGTARVLSTGRISKAAVIDAANTKFWHDVDPLSEFWDDIEDAHLAHGVLKSALRETYLNYCERNQIRRPLANKAWSKACKSRGLDEKKSVGVWSWVLPSATLKVGEESRFGEESDPVSHKSPRMDSSFFEIEKIGEQGPDSAPE